MADFPYINTTGKLREFISKIDDMGVPDSVSTKWLPTVGFGSTNHRPLVGIMRFIGFVSGNKPTERWSSFRDATQAKRVMAEGIAEGYSNYSACTVMLMSEAMRSSGITSRGK